MIRLSKRIAFILSDFSYPPVEGLHQQTIYTIKNLKENDADVVIFGFVKSKSSLELESLFSDHGIELSSPLEQWTWPHVITALVIFLGLFPIFGPIRRVSEGLRGGAFDAVHFDGVAACGFVRTSRWKRVVASIVDPPARRRFRLARAATSFQARAVNIALGMLGSLVERLIVSSPAISHVVSSSDGAYLRSKYRRSSVAVIPVELPSECVDRPISVTGVDRRERDVVLIFGDLRVTHMCAAVGAFFSEIGRLDPAGKLKAQFVVLGRVAPPADLKMVGHARGVEFRDWVDDYISEIDNSSIIVLPDLVGTGIKNRTIQCMARSKAVIGTDTAFEGIPITSGIHGVHCDSIERLAMECVDLCGDIVLQNRIGCAARQLAVREYSGANIAAKWRALYEF